MNKDKRRSIKRHVKSFFARFILFTVLLFIPFTFFILFPVLCSIFVFDLPSPFALPACIPIQIYALSFAYWTFDEAKVHLRSFTNCLIKACLQPQTNKQTTFQIPIGDYNFLKIFLFWFLRLNNNSHTNCQIGLQTCRGLNR